MAWGTLLVGIARLLLNLVIWLRERSRVLDGEARERARRLQEQAGRVEKARIARRAQRVRSSGMRGANDKDKYKRD